MQNLMHIHCSTLSVIFNVKATQYMCSLNSVYPTSTLTSRAKSSLFTHAHSSLLSLAVRLHQCHANCSHYISNGWTFSRQMSYIVLDPDAFPISKNQQHKIYTSLFFYQGYLLNDWDKQLQELQYLYHYLDLVK